MLTVGKDTKLSHLSRYDMYFHLGAGRIRNIVLEEFSDDEIFVQADNDELELIRRQFSNIPMTTNRVVRWSGSDAWFIANNINM